MMVMMVMVMMVTMIMIDTRIAKLLEVAPGGETDDWGEEISTDHNLYQVHDCDDDDSGDGDGDDGDDNYDNHDHQTKEIKGDKFTEGRRVRAVASARQRFLQNNANN